MKQLNSTVLTPNYGFLASPSNGEKVMVEYPVAQYQQPLHLGPCVRNNLLLGYAVANILSAYGCEGCQSKLMNDRNTYLQINASFGKSFINGETQNAGLKGDYLVASTSHFDNTKQSWGHESMGLTEDEAKKTSSSLLEAQELLRK